MTKRKTTPAKKKADEYVVIEEITDEVLNAAFKALDINVPVYTTRIVGGRLELRLYGGRILYYPEQAISAEDA